MNQIKRICAFLLAVTLTLNMALVGEVFAENTEQTEQITEATENTEQVTETPENTEQTEQTTETTENTENGTESVEEPSAQLFYEQLTACESLSDFESLLYAEENSAVMDTFTQEELEQLLMCVEEIYAAIAEPTEEDTLLKAKLQDKLNEYISAVYQKNNGPDTIDSYAETEMNQPATVTTGGPDAYIYFDLAAGDVSIGKTTYTGYVFVGGTETEVTGPHEKNNKYYIYQSNLADKADTGYATNDDYQYKRNCRVPVYNRVKITVDGEEQKWTDYITNNANVKTVSESWDTAAADSGRTETKKRITFAAGGTYDATIDNIWSTYQDYNDWRTTGGITAHLGTTTDTDIQLKLKGDNRFGNIHYHSYESKNNQIVFSNGDSESAPGSVTVADFQTNWGGNHWCSAIGGNDSSYDKSDGIVINSGVIYAGTTAADNCTAIGGGGNEYGGVTINGGTVTAVAATTGTAIGGGIGWGGLGGNAVVTINKGDVYAYNFGIDNSSTDQFLHYVPAVAIGGGSSQGSSGNAYTTITINGGMVYAQCMGGAAIGGGGSATQKGGDATININAGVVIAKSTSGKFKGTADPDVVDIPAGVSIGGGTGLTSGGSVELNISGGILRTGSIGGGLATQEGAKVGSANVTITDGDIIGQVIMAGGGAKSCTFEMSGGRIHDTDLINGNTITDLTDPNPDEKIVYKRDNGGAVFMNDPAGTTIISDGTIEGCHALNGGAIYMNGGTFTLSGTGKIDGNTAHVSADKVDTGMGGAIYMAGGTANINGGTISNNTATVNGGGVYLPGGDFTMNDGIISQNSAVNGGGIYLSKGPVLNKGTISSNTATENGGGLYIEDSLVTLKPEKDLYVTGNKAENNGAGIYIHGSKSSTESSGGSEAEPSTQVDVTGGATPIPEDAVGLLVSKDTKGRIYFTDNVASGDGGAVCVDTQSKRSRFELDTNNITVTGNKATNGGGVAVLKGNFTMTAGAIGESGNPNTANDGGGGVYVSGGDIWLKGGSIKHNTAANGGGAYVGGNYNMIAGEVALNTATGSGGGIYVNDGTVTMYGGSVDSNTAAESGGGMHISSTTTEALVDIFSGSVSNNTAKSGGGISVVSSSGKNIDVTVGVNCEHPNLNEEGSYQKFPYPEASDCGNAHQSHINHIGNIGGESLEHSSCPVVKGNTAEENGGGFFLNSPSSDITIYCLQAEGNTATNDPDSYCMDVQGGHLKIGDENFDIHEPDHQASGAKGNTTIEGTIMVEGGQVDVYGEMENPKFIQDVKVDVTKEQDHYVDHRIIEAGHQDYKVHYYENFKGDGDTPTGLYIARQYPDEEHADIEDDSKYEFTVMSSIFSHPGYKIVGWNTKPDDSGDKYEVNGTYNLKELDEAGKIGADLTTDGTQIHDDYLLVIYAIWVRSGYVLEFDPNVGVGETYTGTMENQRVTVGLLDGSQTIQSNQFVRPGYKFTGWTLNPSPTDTDKVYADGEAITTDFTDEDGASVTLYAQWERCNHVGHLVYTADENILTESCSACNGHSATATVSAVNSVYDEKTHLATAQFSTDWLGEKPEITYDMAASAEWDGKDDIDDNWASNPQPVHAGNYTAMVTVEGVTAKTDYTISPVKWETPAVPQIVFNVDSQGRSVIEITEPTGANIEYKIEQLNTSTNDKTDISEWTTDHEFSGIDFGYYYYFYAKKCADRDHLESTPSQSDAYLANGGNIVYIKNATGIKVVPNIGGGSFKYTVSADNGYHLRDYKYTETDEAIPGATSPKKEDGSIQITETGPTGGEYTYEVIFVTDKVAYWQVTLEFSGAVKNPSIASKVTDGQVFSDFNNKVISISRDSAFTAQFTVSDYIPDEYADQSLKFSHDLPEGTTVIMKTGGNYWYYKLAGKAKDIKLTDFTAMGGTNPFSFDTTGNTAKTFTYQFIVDFSQTAGGFSKDKLNASLKLTAKTSSNVPNIDPPDEKSHISLTIKNQATFALTSTGVVGKTANLNCTYTPSEGAASIWNGRNTALVLTAPSDAPVDLTVTAVVGEKTTIYPMNADRQFIIPLGEIGTKEVKITLNSYLFDLSEKNLAFNADWYVSQSEADISPLNGYKAANCSITFSCKSDVPSVRIDGTKHLCIVGGTLEITVSHADIPSDGTITAYLESKQGGQYISTGLSYPVDTSTPSQNLTFNMGQMAKGSYRILVVVQDSGANILQVPYYFVIAK